jgi:hypothetical protein
MNEVFPEICSVQLGEAASGSIAIIPYPDGLLLALVTNQSVQKHLRSIVILGFNDPNYPPVVLHENWDIRSGCSYYKTPGQRHQHKRDVVASNWRHCIYSERILYSRGGDGAGQLPVYQHSNGRCL